MRVAAVVAVLALIPLARAAETPFRLERGVDAPGADFKGGGLLPSGRLLTWGRDLVEWDVSTGKSRRLSTGPFDGGCVGPDGSVALVRPNGILERRRPPAWKAEFIDNNVHMSDCLWTPLLGHEGLLIIHRNAQLRHYEPGLAPANTRWPYQEIYSIYTASRQTGLALGDVDGDGRTDIFCGNYWVQSPEEYGLPWRLFAIQPYYAEPDAATVSVLPIWGGLVVAQRQRLNAVFSHFVPSEDVKALWLERALGPVRYPTPLLSASGGVLVGENAGSRSRLLWIGGRDRKSVQVIEHKGVLGLLWSPGRIVAIERNRLLILVERKY